MCPVLADTDEADTDASIGGHLKYQFLYGTYPADSLLRSALGPSSTYQSLETRVNFHAGDGPWDFEADYQFIAIYSALLPLAETLPGGFLPAAGVITDDRRWWDLTYTFGDNRTAITQRLDRLYVGYTTERSAWRFGRQAISWGNGLIYTPMDVFNPFDPAAVDKEYKTGDDMLYGQVLLADGSDLQGVAIVRRDPLTGLVEADQSSLAAKYHGFVGSNEYDLLAARHYGDPLLGLGGNVAVGGAVVRGDLTWTDTTRENVWSGMLGFGYSWTWGTHNVSSEVEYYYNGFGQTGGAYAPADLARNPELLARIERGELYTLARNYLGVSLTVEMSPLFLLTPSLFLNIDDPSALAQIVAQYDLEQDLLLRAALNVPIGPDGSEYGGIDTAIPGKYLSAGPSVYAELAWYF